MSLETNWTNLSNNAHKAIKKLEKMNAKLVEAFFTSMCAVEVSIRNSEILTQNQVEDSGVGFRVVTPDKRTGFACTNTLSEKAILETAQKALAIARVSARVPDFAFPEASRSAKVNGLFDTEVAEIDGEEVVDIAKRAIRAAEDFDKRVVAKDGRVLFQWGRRGIVNTLGVDVEEKETRAVIYLGGNGEQNGEVTNACGDFQFSRKADLNPENVGKNVAERIVKVFKPKPVKSFNGTAVFGPEAVSYQICDVLVDALKSTNVIAGRSAWSKKLGQKVGSENLTIADNAVLEEGFASRGFDDEGFASQETVVVKKGELQSFLYDATSAKALKARNTGNASRFAGGFEMVHMIIGNGYRAKPEIYPSNLVIKSGKQTKEKLVSEITEGVLAESTAGFAQAGSGMISAQLSNAFYIKNGEVLCPIKGGMVSGIAFDWFKQISGVGNDSKQGQNSVVPSIRIENVNIVGTV